PKAERLLKRLMGSAEFIRDTERWVLYIKDKDLEFARSFSEISQRLDKVAEFRNKSSEKSTREAAETPHKYYYSVHNGAEAIIIPSTSSERRDYIPMGFLSGDFIITNAANAVFNAEPWLFAVLTSRMHMVWVRAVGGRLKS